MENKIQKQEKPQSSLVQFKNLLNSEGIKNKFEEALGKKAPMFASNLVTIVSTNPELQKCEHLSIISSALMATSMDLPITPGLGIAAIIPYWDNKKKEMKASMQIMKKGFIQLAQRTGLFRKINATEVYEGELVKHDRFTGDMVFDSIKKKSDRIIGYMSYFKLVNGFENYYYMSLEDLEKHARMYSKSYIKGYGKWADKEGSGFHQMCLKTVVKLNLSGYAPLSTDINLQKSVIYDQSEVKDLEGEDYEYFDNEHSEQPTEKEVMKIDDKQVVIDKSRQKKSNDITQKASQSIKTNNKTDDLDILDNPPKNAVKEENGFGEYTEEQLMDMDVTILMSFIDKDERMKKAVDILPNKNTNKKLRGIILAKQGGRLEEMIEPYLDSKEEENDNEGSSKNIEDIEPNANFDNETSETTSNKFNIDIPEIPEGSDMRDFESARAIYQSLHEIDFDNGKFNELKKDNDILKKYRNRDEFCKMASSYEINSVLNGL